MVAEVTSKQNCNIKILYDYGIHIIALENIAEKHSASAQTGILIRGRSCLRLFQVVQLESNYTS